MGVSLNEGLFEGLWSFRYTLFIQITKSHAGFFSTGGSRYILVDIRKTCRYNRHC